MTTDTICKDIEGYMQKMLTGELSPKQLGEINKGFRNILSARQMDLKAAEMGKTVPESLRGFFAK